MSILYIDAFSGVSGDKMAAALLSLGDLEKALIEDINSLDIKDKYEIKITDKEIMGIRSKKFNVILKTKNDKHRGLSSIKNIINNSKISKKAKNISIGIFDILADAESRVHNKSKDEIEFHEIGAVDSIIDIVSVSILLDKLNIKDVYSSPIPFGRGFVDTAHGKLPVPSPATSEILKGLPVYGTEINTELTTPTGAAIIKYLVKDFVDIPEMSISEIGYGAGTKDLSIPNFLRVFYSNNLRSGFKMDEVIELRSNIDDTTPEQLGFLFDRLLEKGAIDVYITSVLMKKNRQGHLLSVICNEKDRIKLESEIFLNSSTFGIRRNRYLRSILDRDLKIIKVEGVDVKIKIGYLAENVVKRSIEHDSLIMFAKEKNISYNEALNRINKTLFDLFTNDKI